MAKRILFNAFHMNCVVHRSLGLWVRPEDQMARYTDHMLVGNQQIHQARLVEHFSVFDAWKLSELGTHAPGSPIFHYPPQIIAGQKQGLG
jgi:hypothetical protein